MRPEAARKLGRRVRTKSTMNPMSIMMSFERRVRPAVDDGGGELHVAHPQVGAGRAQPLLVGDVGERGARLAEKQARDAHRAVAARRGHARGHVLERDEGGAEEE